VHIDVRNTTDCIHLSSKCFDEYVVINYGIRTTTEDKQMYSYHNMEARIFNHCFSGSSVTYTYSKCVFVALSIQHAMRMRHIAMCSLPRSTVSSSHYLINSKIFEKKKFLNTKYVF
jgi:hypothetical protein